MSVCCKLRVIFNFILGIRSLEKRKKKKKYNFIIEGYLLLIFFECFFSLLLCKFVDRLDW